MRKVLTTIQLIFLVGIVVATIQSWTRLYQPRTYGFTMKPESPISKEAQRARREAVKMSNSSYPLGYYLGDLNWLNPDSTSLVEKLREYPVNVSRTELQWNNQNKKVDVIVKPIWLNLIAFLIIISLSYCWWMIPILFVITFFKIYLNQISPRRPKRRAFLYKNSGLKCPHKKCGD